MIWDKKHDDDLQEVTIAKKKKKKIFLLKEPLGVFHNTETNQKHKG